MRITKSENIQTNPKNLVGRALMSIMETDWRIKESNKQLQRNWRKQTLIESVSVWMVQLLKFMINHVEKAEHLN